MGIVEKKKNKKIKNKLTKENFKDYVYVMVSTLNQMVNYIPLKHFEFKKIYNITISDSEYADNEKWDKNLKDIIDKNITDIEFKQKEISNIETIQKRLQEKLKEEKKIFWNITGGQRPFILAINKIVKEDDIVCYLEGNTNQMVSLKNNNEIKDIVSDYDIEDSEDLNIEIALKLMGFEVKDTKTSHRNLVSNYDENEKKFYLEFLKKYIRDKKLRENLILLNRDKEQVKKEIKESLKDLEYSKIDEELGKNKAFGFILEKLAGYKILDLAKDKIADMSLSEKINFSNDDEKVDNSHIDEFDIALLTKNGKFIIFECKSGGMSGDVAKSTKYSTYAISGVYGLPILITPLLQDEINNIDSLDEDTYGYIKSAVKSAKRAGLEVWGLDEIEEKLKKYIEL